MSRYAILNRAGTLIGLTWSQTAAGAMAQARRFGMHDAATAHREAE